MKNRTRKPTQLTEHPDRKSRRGVDIGPDNRLGDDPHVILARETQPLRRPHDGRGLHAGGVEQHDSGLAVGYHSEVVLGAVHEHGVDDGEPGGRRNHLIISSFLISFHYSSVPPFPLSIIPSPPPHFFAYLIISLIPHFFVILPYSPPPFHSPHSPFSSSSLLRTPLYFPHSSFLHYYPPPFHHSHFPISPSLLLIPHYSHPSLFPPSLHSTLPILLSSLPPHSSLIPSFLPLFSPLSIPTLPHSPLSSSSLIPHLFPHSFPYSPLSPFPHSTLPHSPSLFFPHSTPSFLPLFLPLSIPTLPILPSLFFPHSSLILIPSLFSPLSIPTLPHSPSLLSFFSLLPLLFLSRSARGNKRGAKISDAIARTGNCASSQHCCSDPKSSSLHN
ncbi:hypothetical protein C7M84_019555, partial [Penaeus vannamei]